MMTDIRYGLRQLFKHPAFTLVAVLTLALGKNSIFRLVVGQAMLLVAISLVLGLVGR